MTRVTKLSISLFKISLRIINRHPVSDTDAEKIFADRYLTPVASFHTNNQVKKWIKRKKLKILKTGKCKLGTLIWFLVKK
jgi:hypothetical protein